MVQLTGQQFKQIQTALIEAFDLDDLTQMLRTEMDLRLGNIVASGRLETVVFNLLSWMEMHDRQFELISAAYRVRPGNEAVRAVYQSYGLAPVVDLQRHGRALEPPQAATGPGLERTVKHYLPIFDAMLWREQLAALEGRVCRVELNDAGGTMGTGFLVGPEVLLTNYHVLESVLGGVASAGGVAFRFDYKTLANGTESNGLVVQLRATGWDISHSPYSRGEANGSPDDPPPVAGELDYALVRLERPIGQEPLSPAASAGKLRGWVRVPDPDPEMTDRSLFILQHPRRAPLKLALDTEAEPRLIHGGLRLRYDTTTDEGSSGSPCFNSRWTLLALHHYGDPAMGHATFNQGVPIGRIRDHVREALRREGKPDPFGGDPP